MTFKEQFDNWITRLTKNEKPTAEVVAFNFGLFETESGYTIYVIGAKTFDEEDSDWATEVDFEPKDKYLEINPDETKGLEWNDVLEKAKLTIEQFISSDKFNDSFLRNAEAITTGFDDGDLLRIK
jgi:hypothetical protein